MSAQHATLLLIENDPLSLRLYDRELASDYRLFACCDPDQARALLSTETIDLMIVEPGGENTWVWNLVLAVKQDSATQAMPVIFCTVLDEKKRGLAVGATYYLTKPVYAHVLRRYVQDALGSGEKRTVESPSGIGSTTHSHLD